MWGQWTVLIGIVRRSWKLLFGNHGTQLFVPNLFVARRPERCDGGDEARRHSLQSKVR